MISSLQAEDFVESKDGGRLRLTVRKAVMHDIPAILDLINGYAAKGVMLPRTEFEMSEAIRDFTVVLSGEKLLGCGALHFYSPALAEIRSLATSRKLSPRSKTSRTLPERTFLTPGRSNCRMGSFMRREK